MSLELQFNIEIKGTHTSPLDLTTPTQAIRKIYTVDLFNGTGSGNADQIWHDTRTIAASTTEDLDLEATLVDAFGATINPARVKGIIVAADDGNTNSVVLFGDAAGLVTGFLGANTNTVSVQPGGVFVWIAPGTGTPTTATTVDIIQIANSGAGTSVTFDIWLIMASA